MSESKEGSELVIEYASENSTYKQLSSKMADLLSQILVREGIVVHSTTSRCKSIESFSRKVSKPEKSYQSLNEITDLAGIRVTTYFATDVDRVAEVVEREFEIDRNNSIDKRTSIDPDRFGYQSLHYVALLSSSRRELIEYKTFAGKKFEIQIRSILQHAWAEIEHDLGYKSASGVPRGIRRRFARVAGLLEIADDEFCALREELKGYELEVGKKIADNEKNIDLDLPALKSLYSSGSALVELDRAIAAIVSAKLDEGTNDVYERLLSRLLYLGISTVSEAEQMAKQNQNSAAMFAKKWFSKKTYTRFPTGIGTLYLGYLLMAARQDKSAFVEYLNHFRIGAEEGREQEAERAIKIFEEIQTS
ncbi:GTP pyrophosphokinase [Geothrix oryzisoli]|uniref:GTP pyrophosphokinase n=1 Tax=Geothrix oryzisoli TaxID=2922721 RepID=UPI001FAD3F0D|nr:RelA/SpoT domain-containing protein [Geothrix oryzisoli]